MTNLPEKIFLQIGKEVTVNDTCDFNELAGVSWASEKIFNSDIEYIRKDLADDMVKEFGAYVYLTKADDERITDHVVYFNRLFAEFINSQKAEK